jgi:hypothetical protein
MQKTCARDKWAQSLEQFQTYEFLTFFLDERAHFNKQGPPFKKGATLVPQGL